MFMLPPSVKIYVARDPVDMRKSFDGLSILAQGVLKQDPLSGHLFVFFNRSLDRVKILWWSHGGFCLYARRLERGRFWIRRIREYPEETVQMDSRDLAMILEGIDLARVKKRRNWTPQQTR